MKRDGLRSRSARAPGRGRDGVTTAIRPPGPVPAVSRALHPDRELFVQRDHVDQLSDVTMLLQGMAQMKILLDFVVIAPPLTPSLQCPFTFQLTHDAVRGTLGYTHAFGDLS